MEKKTYVLNVFLTVVIAVALMAMVIVRTFTPQIILPEFHVNNMVLVSLAALVLDHYAAPDAKRCYLCIPVFAALAFGILPFAARFVGAMDAVKLAMMGAVVFTVMTWVFTSVKDRLSTGPVAKAAPVVSAVGLYLAVQCLMGMF